MSKKLIRIGGTAYSGSTVLDLMLSNDPQGFSCGEINALFRSFRPHHYNFECGCGDPQCSNWTRIRELGENSWLNNLAEYQQNIEIFVDSSKQITWLYDETKKTLPAEFDVANVLVWKYPEEYAYSCYKRGKLKNWKKNYLTYHRKYFHIVREWTSVPYRKLSANPASLLHALCGEIGIDWFSGKEKYWEKQHHTLFGSNAAKLHLYDRGSKEYAAILEDQKKHKVLIEQGKDVEVGEHKNIYVDETYKEKLPKEVFRDISSDSQLGVIKELLTMTAVGVEKEKDRINSLVNRLESPSKLWFLYDRSKTKCQDIGCRTGIIRG